MNQEETRQFLLETIKKIKYHNEKEKQLSEQEFKMKMHIMMQKTYSITRMKNSKYIKMYKEFIKNHRTYRDNQNVNVLNST